jgi:hypothetical protein
VAQPDRVQVTARRSRLAEKNFEVGAIRAVHAHARALGRAHVERLAAGRDRDHRADLGPRGRPVPDLDPNVVAADRVFAVVDRHVDAVVAGPRDGGAEQEGRRQRERLESA